MLESYEIKPYSQVSAIPKTMCKEDIISQKIIETEWNAYCNPFGLYLFLLIFSAILFYYSFFLHTELHPL